METGKPKLLIDARMVGPKSHGMARYVVALARGLAALRLEYQPVFIVSQATPREKLAGFPCVEAHARFLDPAEMLELPRILGAQRASLYHSPTFSSLLTAPCPWVVTIHDLNHLHFGGIKEKLYYRLLLRSFAHRARAVVTVSRFSREEIAQWLGMPREEIAIAANALDETLRASIGSEKIDAVVRHHGVSRGKYFLCVSNPKPHKNLNILIEAYRIYLKEAGSSAWPLLLSVKGASEIPELRFLGNAVPDGEIRALLEGAGALAFPSLYEGFGLPPVEAAALGVPVIASRIPPHQEGLEPLRQNEVIWASPRDVEEWVNALRRVSSGDIQGASAETRAVLLGRYDAERLGRDMDQIYRRVLGEKA